MDDFAVVQVDARPKGAAEEGETDRGEKQPPPYDESLLGAHPVIMPAIAQGPRADGEVPKSAVLGPLPARALEFGPYFVRQPLEVFAIEDALFVPECAFPVRVRELAAVPEPRRRVARNDVQVDLCVEIHEEREVELVRLEEPFEGRDESVKLKAQQTPLVGFDVDHTVAGPLEDKHRLAEQVLIAIDRERPTRPLLDDRLGTQAQWHATTISHTCVSASSAALASLFMVSGDFYEHWCASGALDRRRRRQESP